MDKQTDNEKVIIQSIALSIVYNTVVAVIRDIKYADKLKSQINDTTATIITKMT